LFFYRPNRFKTIVESCIIRRDNTVILSPMVLFHDVEAIKTRLTCNGRNTDSIVAALGWSGAGATIPPRPLSTPPGNVSCGPGNKTKMSQNTMAKNNRNTHEYATPGCDSVVGHIILTLRVSRGWIVRQKWRRRHARYLWCLEREAQHVHPVNVACKRTWHYTKNKLQST